jgi:hypothetical protein
MHGWRTRLAWHSGLVLSCTIKFSSCFEVPFSQGLVSSGYLHFCSVGTREELMKTNGMRMLGPVAMLPAKPGFRLAVRQHCLAGTTGPACQQWLRVCSIGQLAVTGRGGLKLDARTAIKHKPSQLTASGCGQLLGSALLPWSTHLGCPFPTC